MIKFLKEAVPILCVIGLLFASYFEKPYALALFGIMYIGNALEDLKEKK